jgi:transposase
MEHIWIFCAVVAGVHSPKLCNSCLAKNPRITLHFTPTPCSWLNLVECFFSAITRQAIRRGSFRSVKEHTTAIGNFTGTWNKHPTPLTWTKDADEILASIERAKTKTKPLQTTKSQGGA